MQKNIPKGLLMITLTFLFTLTIAGAAFAATGDQVTNAIVTPTTLPLVNSNSTQGGNDQFVVNTTPAQGFPTNGSSYANINTGNNAESSAKLTLNLAIPQGAKTLSFDWRFATYEYPDWKDYADWAKVEIIDGNSVTNILLLPNGKTVDVKNAWNYLSPTNPNNIGYTATTPMYTTSTDISAYAGKNILLVFSIADAQDKLYTSALFIDNLNIKPVRTSLVVGAGSGFNGNSVPITATLTSNGNPVVGRTVSFTVNGVGAGTAVTNGAGVASVNYLISNMNAGGFPIVATFVQDGQYVGSTGSNTLTVNRNATSLVVGAGSGFNGNSVPITATLTSNGNPVVGRTVSFTVNGVGAGTAVTNGAGVASVNYLISNMNAGGFPIVATFVQDGQYVGSTGSNTLTVNRNATSLVVGAGSGFNGNSVPITATLTSNGNPVVGRTVSFTVNGVGAGTAVTNGAGVASVNYLISNMNAGGFPIVATFVQDGQYVGSTGSNTLTVIPTANVTITKTGNGPLNVGETGTFTITLTNNGPNAANNVVVTDVLPGGFSFGTPSQGSISGNVWNVGTLACGDSATVTVSGLITSDMAGTTINNEATETQDEFTQESQTACASIVVNPMANVTIAKTGNGPMNVGQTGTFTITLTNNGPNAANNVVVTDVLPGGFSFGTPSQGSISGNVWNVGTLACGDSATVTVSGLITSDMAGTTINNEATETQDEFTQESQTACASIYVPSADLVLTKTVDKTKPVVKDVVVFTLIVNNHGPDTSVNVQVADKLPQGLTFVKYTASTGTYDPATGIWTIGDLKNGETAWINITSTVDQVGNITNNASVTSLTYDPNIEGSSSSASIDAQQSQSGGGGVNPDNGSGNYSSVGAETVAMQKTGVPIGMILTALLMLVTGLVMPRKK